MSEGEGHQPSSSRPVSVSVGTRKSWERAHSPAAAAVALGAAAQLLCVLAGAPSSRRRRLALSRSCVPLAASTRCSITQIRALLPKRAHAAGSRALRVRGCCASPRELKPTRQFLPLQRRAGATKRKCTAKGASSLAQPIAGRLRPICAHHRHRRAINRNTGAHTIAGSRIVCAPFAGKLQPENPAPPNQHNNRCAAPRALQPDQARPQTYFIIVSLV